MQGYNNSTVVNPLPIPRESSIKKKRKAQICGAGNEAIASVNTMKTWWNPKFAVSLPYDD